MDFIPWAVINDGRGDQICGLLPVDPTFADLYSLFCGLHRGLTVDIDVVTHGVAKLDQIVSTFALY
ncbi:hypothetical protein A5689_24470 [Mycobacterium intracellulare subsp. yongonense]|nr:hypothetical protein A5689_24470 [Mycobacterium intracellulare subsp. yongonense]